MCTSIPTKNRSLSSCVTLISLFEESCHVCFPVNPFTLVIHFFMFMVNALCFLVLVLLLLTRSFMGIPNLEQKHPVISLATFRLHQSASVDARAAIFSHRRQSLPKNISYIWMRRQQWRKNGNKVLPLLSSV